MVTNNPEMRPITIAIMRVVVFIICASSLILSSLKLIFRILPLTVYRTAQVITCTSVLRNVPHDHEGTYNPFPRPDVLLPYNEHLSTEEFYTSDYDLSEFNAHQYGLGVSYSDIFTKMHIWKFGVKSLDLEFSRYQRNSGLDAFIITAGASFVLDH